MKPIKEQIRKSEGLKRCYFVNIKDELNGEAVIATSNQEAKKLAWPKLCLDGEWIDLRARIVAGSGQVRDFPIGRMKDMRLALKRGLFSSIENEKCDICGKETYVVCYNDKIVCGDCEEDIYQACH
jgi:hypothetical protein